MVESPSEIRRDQRNGQVDMAASSITTPTYDANDVHQLCRQLSARIAAFLDEDAPTDRLKRVQEQTRISLGVIEDALRRYRLDELSLSYNGGKDCLVLLILFLAALANHSPSPSSEFQDPSPGIQSVYIVSPHPFAEVDAFVAESTAAYNLNLARYSKPMKTAFAEYLEERPHVKAIFVGTRRTDPHGADLTFFDRTDHGWPDFMRVHPVIDWHYAEIWAFIRHLSIPYCPLYDRGYTSLGGVTDTHPNPALRALPPRYSGPPTSPVKEGGAFSFRPAYELVDDEEERLGRDR